MKEFNINDYVKVKLTKTGMDIMKQYYVDIAKNTRNPKDAIETFGRSVSSKMDEEGYLSMQLHEVMNIFGWYIKWQKGLSGDDLPFDTTILIRDEDLKDKPDGKRLSSGI